jgi:hypothetical protein
MTLTTPDQQWRSADRALWIQTALRLVPQEYHEFIIPQFHELMFQVDEAKLAMEMMKENCRRIDEMMKVVYKKYGNYMDLLLKPHYLTVKEMSLYRDKGIEALFRLWKEELKKIDAEGKEKYGFPLPKT